MMLASLPASRIVAGAVADARVAVGDFVSISRPRVAAARD
jgi:hypothetical protein